MAQAKVDELQRANGTLQEQLAAKLPKPQPAAGVVAELSTARPGEGLTQPGEGAEAQNAKWAEVEAMQQNAKWAEVEAMLAEAQAELAADRQELDEARALLAKDQAELRIQMEVREVRGGWG